MKIEYRFNDGTVSKIEVSDDIGEFILESRRKESNLDKKESRHDYSLDAVDFEGIEYADKETVEDVLSKKESQRKTEVFLTYLTDKQRNRIELLMDGCSYREIARIEGVDHKQVIKSIKAVREKFLKQGPQMGFEMSV